MREPDMSRIVEYEATIPVSEYLDKYVDFGATLERCRECSNYGASWFCPPYDFDPVDKIWRNYSDLRIICFKVMLDGLGEDEVTPLFFDAKKHFDDKMLELEGGNPGSLALSAGFCARCETCARAEGKPCRMPDKARHSIEAIGGLVDGTVKGLLGFDVLWSRDGKLPEYYILIGGILLK